MTFRGFLAAVTLALSLSFPLSATPQQEPARKPPSYKTRQAEEKPKKPLYKIQVEDAVEAELIEQELKVKPELVRDRSFYYSGDEVTNKRLREFGYEPVLVDRDEVFSRVVFVPRRGNEELLREVGATVVLRELRYWIVRASPKQLRVLERLGFVIQDLGRREPHPRQVFLVVKDRAQVEQAAQLGVDIYTARPTQRGLEISGAAFDDAIDQLRARGYVVEIEPDPPGVNR